MLRPASNSLITDLTPSCLKERSNMKAIIIVLTISFIAVLGDQLRDEQKVKLRGYKESCINESGVDITVIENAKKGKIAENDKKFACFATCLLNKARIMNADGDVDWDRARFIFSSIPQERLDEIYDACKHITGTGCEKGGKLFKCFIDNNINIL